jgi:DNA-binding transcriptional regulator YhcF (GntR family)
MTAVAWARPVRMPKRRTRRDEILEWVCRYADEMDGPTPSINEIALHFKLNYKTVYYHVMKLIVEGRLRQERGKLVVVGSERIEPSVLPVQQRYEF